MTKAEKLAYYDELCAQGLADVEYRNRAEEIVDDLLHMMSPSCIIWPEILKR